MALSSEELLAVVPHALLRTDMPELGDDRRHVQARERPAPVPGRHRPERRLGRVGQAALGRAERARGEARLREVDRQIELSTALNEAEKLHDLFAAITADSTRGTGRKA